MNNQTRIDLIKRITEIEGLSDKERSALLGLLRENKSFGLVWEDKPEAVRERLKNELPIVTEVKERAILSNEKDAPNHIIIEGDNLEALSTLAYTHAGKLDVIYIDPPYNTGARDWKYNNDYVDTLDAYRHSKWLSMMSHRLKVAKTLLNPENSVLIVTIDEKEYLHLGCLLEQMFLGCRVQMVSSVINTAGATRQSEFSRTDEYLFFVYIGEAKPQPLLLEREWLIGKSSNQGKITWDSLKRAGGHNKRTHSPGCFYPIFVNTKGTKIVQVGNVLPSDVKREEIEPLEDSVVIWPMQNDDIEGCWQTTPEKLRVLIAKGFVKLGKFTGPNTMAISYLKRGEQQKVESGFYTVTGHREDGSIIVDNDIKVAAFLPGTQWNIPSHNAKQNGTILLSSIIGKDKFTFPKSLYAVHDALRFFVADKPEAQILDFFAGSGTTLHATMLLNSEDKGKRRCILVTNNENNICEEVTYERNRRVIEGYTSSKGETIPGLKNNNLRYYRTGFVSRERSTKNMRSLMSLSTDMLCIKENLYKEISTFGNLKTLKNVFRYFSDDTKHMLIIYREEAIDDLVEEIYSMNFITPLKVYVFSPSEDPWEASFEDVMDKIQLCALPQAIYNTYKRILPRRTDSVIESKKDISDETEVSSYGDGFLKFIEEGAE